MNKSRNSIPLSSLPPKLREQAEKQLGMQPVIIPEAKTPRALQPMKQDHGSKMNKLETAFFEYLKTTGSLEDIYPQGITLRLANGCRYTPDFSVFAEECLVCYETKGPFFREDAKIKLKVAAHQYPQIRFYLVQKIEGQWRIEKVLP